jgi:hypothetical protein
VRIIPILAVENAVALELDIRLRKGTYYAIIFMARVVLHYPFLFFFL